MNPAPGRGRFATTHWSLVLAAARDEDRDGRLAMESLFRERYWYPLYVFVRRRGYPPEDAQVLTQAFFARLLDKGDVAGASPALGRFRLLPLASLRHFLINECERARALKRGGALRDPSSIDMTDAEELLRRRSRRRRQRPMMYSIANGHSPAARSASEPDQARGIRARRQVGDVRPARRLHDRHGSR